MGGSTSTFHRGRCRVDDMTTRDIVSFADVEASGLDDWRQLFEALRTRFLTGDFATGLRLCATRTSTSACAAMTCSG